MESAAFGRIMSRKGAIMSKFMHEQTQNNEIRLIDNTYRISTGISHDLNMNEMQKHTENDVVICLDQEDPHHESSDEVLVISSDESMDEKSSNYECPECEYETSHYSVFKAHLRLHTTGKPYECDICSKQYAFSVSLTHHKKLHKFINIFRCSVCRNGLNREEDFLKHTSVCKRDLFACSSCEYTTRREVLMNTHRRTHLKNKPYQCFKCFKAFLKKSGFDKHIQEHLDEHSKHLAEIEIREKKFLRKDQLILNMATNGNKFPFECSKCKLPFSEEYDKRAHEELCQRRQYNYLWNFTNLPLNNNANRPQRREEVPNKNVNNDSDGETDIEIINDKELEPSGENEEVIWRPWI